MQCYDVKYRLVKSDRMAFHGYVLLDLISKNINNCMLHGENVFVNFLHSLANSFKVYVISRDLFNNLSLS